LLFRHPIDLFVNLLANLGHLYSFTCPIVRTYNWLFDQTLVRAVSCIEPFGRPDRCMISANSCEPILA